MNKKNTHKYLKYQLVNCTRHACYLQLLRGKGTKTLSGVTRIFIQCPKKLRHQRTGSIGTYKSPTHIIPSVGLVTFRRRLPSSHDVFA